MTRVSGSSGVSESTIVFYNGGHSHDGVSSSLVDTDEYSIYDWTVGYVGSGSRLSRQQTNFNALKEVITNVVVDSLLGPTGIRLAPNTLHATVIESGTISANQLSANIVLINNVIRSNNFDGNVAANGSITSPGTAGWAIAGDGTAVFDSSYIRGAIIANSVSTPGVDILANGAIVSTNFNVNPQGNITATNANISGTVTASMIEASTFYIDAFNYWGSDGEFRVGSNTNYLIFDGTDLLLSGEVAATSGSIGSWTITPTNIYNNTGAANTVLSANGFITAGTLKIGNNDISDAEDIVATNIIRGGRFEATTKFGVVYTGAQANSNSTGDFGFSFYYNGTNVYARLTDTGTGSHFDVCLTNCGAGTTSGTTAATTTTTTTVAPGGGGGGGGGGTTTTTAPACPAPQQCGALCCPDGQICFTVKGESYCTVYCC